MESEIPKKRNDENPWINLIFNVAIPVLFLSKGDRWISNPAHVLIIALLFPVSYFVWDLKTRNKVNFISILGFVSVLLTGGVGLLQLPRFWFVVKEAAIPGLIGLFVLGSAFTRKPVVKLLVFNAKLFDVEQIQQRLNERNNDSAMKKLLKNSTLLLAVSFFISAILNFVLASVIIKTEPSLDPIKFNNEVGAMTGWSYLVIALPSTLFLIAILFYLAKGIKRLTGLGMEEALAPSLREKQ